MLLYADDAALPADSVEDLQLAAQILEAFCNRHRLFIAVPKTYVTVFHNSDDTSVVYDGRRVFADGELVNIKIYGQSVAATPSFKYLGVVLHCSGKHSCHFEARFKAFENAASLFFAGLSRVASLSSPFAQYLWKTLVLPVATYGMSVFPAF